MPRAAVVGAIVLLASTSGSLSAQDATLGALNGRVIADGRPVNWVVEVRLDSETLGKTLATAYTLGSEEFQFLDLPVDSNDTYFLVIQEDGYEEIRYRIDSRDFMRDPRNEDRLAFAGVLIFHLVPLPSEEQLLRAEDGTRAVNVRRLATEIPDAAREHFESAMEELGKGRDQDALRHLQEALALAPDYYDALNQLGIQYLKIGRYREAETVLENARDLGPDDPKPLVNLGTLHFQEGQALDLRGETGAAEASYLRSVSFLEDAVRLDPLVAESNLYLGSAFYETGDLERAEAHSLRALELDEELSEARLTLVNIYVRQQRYTEALDQIHVYLEADPESPRRGALETIRGQIEQALLVR